MVNIFYCFYADCYIGRLLINTNGNKKFIAEGKENYTKGAKNFVKYMPLNNTSDIDAFIHERVIPNGRPDKSIWITQLKGITPSSSDLEIFLANQGRCVNDFFWLDTKK